MTTAFLETDAPSKIWTIEFAADGAEFLPDVGRPWRQVGIRRLQSDDSTAATLGGGVVKVQSPGAATPSADNDDHWLDTVDTTLSALEIGKMYQIMIAGPVRIALSGATSPNFIVEVR